ncbi:MAG: hypothetical protein ACTSPX_05685 [Candidatus Thorarchaeota archaeon]
MNIHEELQDKWCKLKYLRGWKDLPEEWVELKGEEIKVSDYPLLLVNQRTRWMVPSGVWGIEDAWGLFRDGKLVSRTADFEGPVVWTLFGRSDRVEVRAFVPAEDAVKEVE